MLAVTTFHPEAGRTYAKRCLESLVQHFPGRIIAYFEELPDYQHERIEYRALMQIPGLPEFLERVKKIDGADGKTDGKYDFRYNANAFCRKVFAQDAAFDEAQYVYWFDSDSYALQALSWEWLESLVKDFPFAYLGRKGPQTYTETGFIAFNTKHPDFQKFRSNYLSYFTTGRIFSQLKGWHDCIAFDHAREGINGHNLSPQGQGFTNVIVESKIGKHIFHAKGWRKHK